MLLTPLIDLSPLTSPELSFEWFSNKTDNPSDSVPLILEIFDGTSWNDLDTLIGDNASWLNVFYDLSPYAGNTIQVRFMTNQTIIANGSFYNDILLNEVRIVEMTTCFPPSNLAVANVTSTYDFYIQSDCGVNQSTWEGPFTFTTPFITATGIDMQVACDTYTWIDGMNYTADNNTAIYTIGL
jgi:hypothetical protein